MLCYGHKSSMGTVRCLFHQNGTILHCPILDIVRCPVKLRYYLKFHSACRAFGRVIEGKMVWCPAGVCTHWTGTRRFCLKFKSYNSNFDSPGTNWCFMSRTATGEKWRVFAEVHIASTYIIHFWRSKTKIQIYIFTLSSWGWLTCNKQVLLKCLQSWAIFLLHHCQSQPKTFFF